MSDPSFLKDSECLDEVLARRAALHPDRSAFFEDGRSLTFASLEEEAGILAGGLRRAGVERGDRVVLSIPAGLDFVRVFYAVQRLGAASCAMNPYVPAVTGVRRAARVRPKLIVTAGPSSEELLQAAKEAGVACFSIDAISRDEPAAPPLKGDRDAIAFLQPTSGTAGESRTAVILNRNLVSSLLVGCEEMELDESDVFVGWVPPWHDLGLVRFVIGTVWLGAVCHIVRPAIETISHWMSTIAAARGTLTGAPDFALRLAARLVKDAVDITSLGEVIDGGEAVRLSTIAAFEERFGLHNVIRPGYGLAEATLGVACVRRRQPLRTDDRGNVSCGPPFAEMEVRIDSSHGEPGEILARGPAVFAGYFDADDATRETLRDGWLHTGDIGRMDADGWLYVLGRNRAMLKRGGAVLAPRELEESAHQVKGVKLAAAIGIAPTDETEEIVVAVESESEHAERLAAAVAEAIQQTVGFAPERVVVLEPRSIPRTWNGKIRHDALRAMLTDGTLERKNAVRFGL